MASNLVLSIVATRATTIACLKAHDFATPFYLPTSTLKGDHLLLPHKSPFFPPLVQNSHKSTLKKSKQTLIYNPHKLEAIELLTSFDVWSFTFNF
jgi:hypothetical protein